MTPTRIALAVGLVLSLSAAATGARAWRAERIEYRVLATSKTSTMDKEMNAAADEGFRFQAVMGGSTAVGGNEVVVVMGRVLVGKPRFQYRLLATNKTSTMQKELQESAEAGYEYRGQTVFTTAFGGEEVVCLLERDRENTMPNVYQYQLLATSKTSTMQKELLAVGEQGFEVVGLTVGKTALGGTELVTITRRKR